MSQTLDDQVGRALAPVRQIPGDTGDEPADGRALCLSGGGYRAMCFHLGSLWRLNEAGLLPTLDRVSSVSGGSIAAGVLALAWPRLDFDARRVAGRFGELVAAPLRRLAGVRLDVESIVLGLVSPGAIAERVAEGYRAHLFADATLQDLPDHPRFVLCATSVQSGALVRLAKPYLADYKVGTLARPQIGLAEAVAASSAFPPVLSPAVLRLDPDAFETVAGNTLTGDEYRERMVLSDGGVYDNLGLETAWKRCRTILVSDGGGQMAPEARPSRLWPLHLLRVLAIIDNQVRSLRKRQVVGSYVAGLREGAYWGIRSHIGDFPVPDPLPCPEDQTRALAELPTRLAPLTDVVQERLVNWGYAVTDAALRAHLTPAPTAAEGFPYPASGVG